MSKIQVPPSKRARILELRAKGCPEGVLFDPSGRGTSAGDTGGRSSFRAIAAVMGHEGYTTTDVTVRAVVQDAESRGWSATKGAAEVQPSAPREPSALLADDRPEIEDLPELPEDATVAARLLYRDIQDSDRRLRELPNDADFASEYSNIARVKMQQVKALAALIPPSKPDPKHDPTNLAARELIRDRVLYKVAGVFERARRLGYVIPGDE